MPSQKPWHLWGNTQRIETSPFTIPAGDDSSFASGPAQGQLARVAYGRPDTFHWLFHSLLVGIPDLLGAGLQASDEALLEVHFDLTVGIGRSQITIQDFEVHSWDWLVSGPPAVNDQLYTTSVEGKRSEAQDGTLELTLIDEITAQHIQLSSRNVLTITRGSTDVPVTIPASAVLVSAHFAPKTHVRPSWFSKIGLFQGQEEKEQL